MQHDEVIWQVINQGFCSYKVKMETNNFCKNKYNITGLCNRSACPLANSRYATILEEKGICYLVLKTIERAHTPKNMWERIKLPRNYAQALKLIDSNLQYWPKFLIHKSKQRLTKIHQYLIRMRKLKLKVRPKMVGIYKKVERRERNRERKAEKAARLTNAIENELIQRLQQGTYDTEGIINAVPVDSYQKVLGEVGEEDESEKEEDEDQEEESEMEDEDEDQEESEEESEYEQEDEDEEEFVEEYEFEEEDEDLEDFGDQEKEARAAFSTMSSDDEDDDDEDDDDDDDNDDDEDKRRRTQGKKRPRAQEGGPRKQRKMPRARINIEYEDELPLQEQEQE